jgi:predicted RNA methylase
VRGSGWSLCNRLNTHADAPFSSSLAGTYYAAVLENRADFEGKIVVDVGAGSGILSLFAAQAGAKMVYAIEASDMAQYAKRLAAGNGEVGSRITVSQNTVVLCNQPAYFGGGKI